MHIVITQWALDSYLELKHEKAFSPVVYKDTIRPDVKLLEGYPANPKFSNDKFWSQVTLDKRPLPNAFKMKWHNLGDRHIQLRLTIGIGFDKELSDIAFMPRLRED